MYFEAFLFVVFDLFYFFLFLPLTEYVPGMLCGLVIEGLGAWCEIPKDSIKIMLKIFFKIKNIVELIQILELF